MITFFTTTKNFIGHNLISQLNAINSWVCQKDFESEVLLFGEEEGIEVLSHIPNVTLVSYTERNENGVPYQCRHNPYKRILPRHTENTPKHTKQLPGGRPKVRYGHHFPYQLRADQLGNDNVGTTLRHGK